MRKMIRSRSLSAPVITILSPCLTASKKAVSLLSAVGNMEEIPLAAEESSDQTLNDAFKSSLPGLSQSWDSVGARCRSSGSIIHFCSNNNTTKENSTPFALLAITDEDKSIPNKDERSQAAISRFRNLLAARINHENGMNSTILNLKSLISGNLTITDLLKYVSSDGLPLLSIPEKPETAKSFTENETLEREKDSSSLPFLKEVVVPYFDDASYIDGSTLMSKLFRNTTNRPAVGVFEWPDSTTCIRPLPTADVDKVLPPPSLIFHSESPEDLVKMKESGFREARIGYGGLGPSHGQVMLLHENLRGLDIRYCPRTTVSSSFSEAQESLLAGSLDELQSANVLASGGGSSVSDKRIDNGDCWVEVRASLKQPTNYWQRTKKVAAKQKIAKVPDLPYE